MSQLEMFAPPEGWRVAGGFGRLGRSFSRVVLAAAGSVDLVATR